MKLNEEGWGLGVFVICLSVFFVAIIVVALLTNKVNLSARPGEDNNEVEPNEAISEAQKYSSYETAIKSSAQGYKNENYPDIKDGDLFYVNIDSLSLGDEIKNDCDGYAKIGMINGTDYYEAYIKCSKYTTAGYDEEQLKSLG